MDARLARSQEEPDPPYAAGESAFRIDLERIRFATALSRLADVTQVVTSMATSGVVHNRLTHTIKVTAVARAIAVRLLGTEDHELLMILVVLIMSWYRQLPLLMILVIHHLDTSANESLID